MDGLMNIYALSDPREPHDYRYVGRTVKNPAERLKGHVQVALSKTPDGSWRNAVTHKNAWIRSLARDGYRPIATLLAQCEPRDLVFAEQQMIATLREAGYRLTNATEGGEGPHLYKASDQTRRRQSEAGRRRFANNPSEREFYRQVILKRIGTPQGRLALSRQATDQWSAPGAREAQSQRLKTVNADPGLLARRTRALKQTLADETRGPQIRAALSQRVVGEGNPSAKLTWPVVRQIRAEYAAGGFTHADLGGRYGVTPSTIQQIINCVIWTKDPAGVEPTAIRRAASPKVTDEQLTELAAVYRSSLASGQPSQAVARHFNITPVRAYGWIAKARQRGFLGATVPGASGEQAS
jgi:hypothetical protein